MTRQLSGTQYMLLAAARELAPAERAFVGVGVPGRAALLATALLDPAPYLIFESGCLGSRPAAAPSSVADAELAETADTVVSVPEIFNYWVQGGWIDVAVLGAAQIDRHGGINTTVIGDYAHPRTRLPGAGGAPTIAGFARRTIIVAAHDARTFVDNVDFLTTPGLAIPGRDRGDLGLDGAGVVRVITDLGVLAPGATGELELVTVHPGVSAGQVRAKSGWPLAVAADLRSTPPPDERELAAIDHAGKAGAL